MKPKKFKSPCNKETCAPRGKKCKEFTKEDIESIRASVKTHNTNSSRKEFIKANVEQVPVKRETYSLSRNVSGSYRSSYT